MNKLTGKMKMATMFLTWYRHLKIENLRTNKILKMENLRTYKISIK